MKKGIFVNRITVFLVLISVIFAIPLTTAAQYSVSFTDVKEGNSHYTAIMELAEADIISGYTNGEFGVNDKLQRSHAAVLLFNALGLVAPVNEEEILAKHYDDISPNYLYSGQIAAVTPDIFKGSNRMFNAEKLITREQMATTLVNAFKLEDDGTDPGVNLSNVGTSHKQNVKILAQHGITNQLDDFRPKESVTRGQFASFLYQTIKEDASVITANQYDIDFERLIEIQSRVNPKVDGAGRFEASKELVAYYANSHNFEVDSPEFMQFLLLSEPAGLDADELNEKVLKGKGTLEGTGEAFIEAAQRFNINEVYLIAHALHETGNGTSALASGITVNGKKTYNMYGIGAYDECPQTCGSQRAYDEGWFTPEDAIIGGARFIGNNYINQGQDTLYKMRWNPDNPGTHQYATHVSWAVNQTYRIQNIYNLLDTYVLVFDVPVFQNQPEYSPKPTGEDQYSIDYSKQGLLFRTTTTLNMRSAPSTAYSIITTLPQGKTVEVIGENGGWYKVKADNRQGWVSGAYLTSANLLEVVNVENRLYVREEPTNKSNNVGSVWNGDTVVAELDANGDFIIENSYYKVIFDGKEAWLHGDYLKEM
ncbi:SH3 domain-containing protein [Virgibacillus sediminis]|uniref:SH3 domain-containing protein n=1 Tax=Virgibacillus sediminis TaxID=202260 RepID=A0ABV7A3P5_9BACI